jgi:hypothetical protein
MFGKKSDSNEAIFSNYTDYIMHLLMNLVGPAAPGHNIELAVDLESDRASVYFDDTRIYFTDSLVGPSVGLMELQAPIFRSFKPSAELISELALINKVLVSVNLVPESEASFDLVVSADLLLTGHPNEDAINVAVILTTIADVHTELYNRFVSM